MKRNRNRSEDAALDILSAIMRETMAVTMLTVESVYTWPSGPLAVDLRRSQVDNSQGTEGSRKG